MNGLKGTQRVLTRDELDRATIETRKGSATSSIDFSDTPDVLKPLIPYVEIWGVADDLEREEIIDKTSPTIKEHLTWVIRNFDDELDEWLAGPETESPISSDAYVSFSAFRMAVDFI